MAIDTKPNLSSNRFEQFSNDELDLSGDTHVYGTIIIESGATLSIKENAASGKMLVSDGTGNATWQDSSGGDAVTYQGEWNASTNVPTLPDASGVTGYYYVVNSGGTYNNIDFRIRDWVVSDGIKWDIVRNHTAPFFLTQAEYDALTEQEKSDTSKFYLIEDEFTLSGITGATNGLSKSGAHLVELGGALTKNTSLTGNYTLTFSGDSKLNTICGYQISGITIFRTTPYNITNIAIGQDAMFNATGGTNNIAMGCKSLFSNITGCCNVAIGNEAGYNETGSSKLHIANCASCSLITGDFIAKTICNGSNSTSWDTSSDCRIKENMSGITNAVSIVLQLNPVIFDYTTGYTAKVGFDENVRVCNYGFIAQEFETVFPNYVKCSEGYVNSGTTVQDFRTINSGHLVPILVKAIQELEARVQQLES